MNSFLTIIIVILASVALPVTSAFAQFVGVLGSSSFSKQTYSCRTYPGGQDVIIQKGSKTKTVSRKKGSESVARALTKINDVLESAKKVLADRKKRLNKLLNSPTIVLPSVAQEIEELRDTLIPQAENRVEVLLAQKSELTFLRTAVKNCGKGPQINGGGNQLFSATANGPVTGEQFYLLGARHVFTFSGVIPNEICTEIDGKISSAAWSQNVCCQANDGTGSSNPFTFCADTGLRPDQGFIGLGGACGKFSSGRFDIDSEEVNKTLSKVARVFLPDKSGKCL